MDLPKDSYQKVLRLHALAGLAALPVQTIRATRVAREAVGALAATACSFRRVCGGGEPEPLAFYQQPDAGTASPENLMARLAAEVAASGDALRSNDPAASSEPDGGGGAEAAAGGSYLGVPFFDSSGRLAGVAGVVAGRGREFTEEDEWWLRAAAQMVATALACEEIDLRLHALAEQPGSDEHQQTTAEHLAETPADAGQGKFSVLVVDDDRAVNRLVCRYLTKEQYTVDSAADGLEALRLFRPTEHDLVISDIVMPHMNGWELTAALRAQQPRLPIVLVTGYSSNGGGAWNKQFLQKQGVVAVLNKPFDFDFLGSVIADIVRNKRPQAFR